MTGGPAAIPPAARRRLAAAKLPDGLLDGLLGTPGLATSDDTAGLLVLWQSGLTAEEILTWARLGSLEAAFRLESVGITAAQAAAFPLAGGGLHSLVRVVQEAAKHGLRADDLPLWLTGGVVSLTPPFVHEARFARWRATAVHHIGMRRAAVACAAGLSPDEATALVHAGTFTEEPLRLLAALRHPPGRA